MVYPIVSWLNPHQILNRNRDIVHAGSPEASDAEAEGDKEVAHIRGSSFGYGPTFLWVDILYIEPPQNNIKQ